MRQLNGFATLFVLLMTLQTYASHTDEYIQGYKDIAQREMQRSGIPASIILAQGIHESAWGQGDLAVNSNNHFGIKCKDYWEGPRYFHKDDDYVNGKLVKSCFRAYQNVEDSYIDHTNFLIQTKYYEDLFDYDETDYRNWAYGLKRCGYATDPAYAEKLIGLIERYQLYQYDQLRFLAVASDIIISASVPEPKPVVEVMDAPSYYIPEAFMPTENMVVQQNDYKPANQAYVQTNYNDEPVVEYSNTGTTGFRFEVTPPAEEQLPVELPVTQPVPTISEPQTLPANSYQPATAVMPNTTAKDRRLKNLSRRPRMSVGAGPR